MNDAEKAYQFFVIAVPENEEQAKAYFWARKALQPTLTPPNEPLTCEGCACESYPRDCYPCNTCNRNDETLSDQYHPPEGEEDT